MSLLTDTDLRTYVCGQKEWADKTKIHIYPYELNFRTRLSESICLFFNKKRGYFAMQVATAPRKLAAVL